MQLVDVVFVLLVIVSIFHPGGMWCYAEVENLAGPTAWLSRNLSTGSLSGGGDGPRWPTHGGKPQSKNVPLMMILNIATQGLPRLLGARDGDAHWGN